MTVGILYSILKLPHISTTHEWKDRQEKEYKGLASHLFASCMQRYR